MWHSDDSTEARLLELQVLLEAILRHFPGVVVQVASTGPQTYEFLLVSEGCFDGSDPTWARARPRRLTSVFACTRAIR